MPAIGADLRETNVTYGRCVVKHAQVYAKEHERPHDIADAALAYCTTERAQLRAAMMDSFEKETGTPNAAKVDALLHETDELARRAALRAVLEARYPEDRGINTR